MATWLVLGANFAFNSSLQVRAGGGGSPAFGLALADAYRDAGRRAESHQQLLEILHMPVLLARTRANSATQEKARQLLSK